MKLTHEEALSYSTLIDFIAGKFANSKYSSYSKDDLKQEMWAELLTHDIKCRYKGFIYIFLRNKVIDYLRSSGYKYSYVTYDDDVEGHVFDIVGDIDTKEKVRLLEDGVKSLNARYRYIFKKLLNGATLKAIGDELNITQARVYQIRLFLIKKLRKNPIIKNLICNQN